MAFPKEFLHQLKTQANIVSVLGKRMKLTRKGREYEGLCPFHGEKTPSFTVNAEKGFYHCFGCGAHGDSLHFIVEFDKLPFAEAVRVLAGETGMAVPVLSKENQAQYDRNQRLVDACREAMQFFRQQLYGMPGSIARQYLGQRGLANDTIERFELGYAPQGTRLFAALRDKGFTENELAEAGLIGVDTAKKQAYDRFRHRLMFPIRASGGDVVAFGGRSLDGTDPKYLNSPETPIFHKGKLLYGLPLARKEAAKTNSMLVAEGYMDVIALHQAGITNAVAPLGTAMTEQHLQLAWQVCDTVILSFDGDSAGQRAARRAAEKALPLLKTGKTLTFLHLPAGEDPDSLIRQHGADSFRSLLTQATPLAQQLLAFALQDHAPDTPDGKAALLQSLETMAGQITDGNVASFYKQDLKNLFYTLLRQRQQNTFKGGKKPVVVSSSPATLTQNMAARREQAILAVCLHCKDLLEEFIEPLGTCTFVHPGYEQLRQRLLERWMNGSDAIEDEQAWFRTNNLEALWPALQALPPVFRGKEVAQIKAEWLEMLALYQGQRDHQQERLDLNHPNGIEHARVRLRQRAALVAMEN
jgi:DNA primase